MASSLPSKIPDEKQEQEHANASPKTQTQKYKEQISTLPRESSLIIGAHFYKHQGFCYDPAVLEGVLLVQEHFKAQPSDIVVCSPAKAGTTWLKSLTFAIVTRTKYEDSTNPLLTTSPHECMPILEIDLCRSSSNRDPKLPLLATHIPYTSLPKSIIDSGCKIVYICRDPKDVFVSLWHFYRNLKWGEVRPLEETFEMFCRGSDGSYWDHVLGYWKGSLEQPERVLFLKYEDMKKDGDRWVKRLAEFMGYPFSLEEEKEGVVQKIINFCSFENLSNLEVNKTGNLVVGNTWVVENNVYFRKGKIRDWENYLTLEMVARIDQITEQKLMGSGLTLHA